MTPSEHAAQDLSPARGQRPRAVPGRSLAVLGLLLLLAPATALAQASGSQIKPRGGAFGNIPEDPSTAVVEIDRKNAQREALFPVSLFNDSRDSLNELKNGLYDATRLRVNFAWNQVLTGVLGGDDLPNDVGTTTDFDAYIAWEILNPGQPNQGKFLAHFEGRWDYGTTSPADLGAALGSGIGIANGFDRYDPAFLPVRNVYWEQGGPEAGWAYRVGFMTPDGMYGTSKHLTPLTTFLSPAGTGGFVQAPPDSGFGIAGVYHINEDIKIHGGLHDANADRFTWGDVTQGDFWKVAQVSAKLFPKTEESGYSTLTFFQTPGTADGVPSNGESGRPGWGFYAVHEQEFSDDGDLVGVFRYGHAFNNVALYNQQAGAALLLYDTPDLIGISNDVVGAQYH